MRVVSVTYPASYAIGLVAPWLVLSLAARAGVDTGDALSYLGPSSVLGACVIGGIALATRRLCIRPRTGDAAAYLSGIAIGGLALLPMMLVAPVMVAGEARFDELELAPAIAACFGVGGLALACELIVSLLARTRRRAGR